VNDLREEIRHRRIAAFIIWVLIPVVFVGLCVLAVVVK